MNGLSEFSNFADILPALRLDKTHPAHHDKGDSADGVSQPWSDDVPGALVDKAHQKTESESRYDSGQRAEG